MAGSVKKHKIATIAVHAHKEDNHAVGIFALNVMVLHDDGSWFAQGLEIDYASEGNSLKDVQKKFGDGLYHTIKLHLQMYGNIKKILKVAPEEIWDKFYNNKDNFEYTQIGIHNILNKEKTEFPFNVLKFAYPKDSVNCLRA